MASADTSPSRSAAAVSLQKYDVFINFRGEDTRYNFTSHLHAALLRNKVETYIDYRLEKGEEVWPELVKAIEDSHVSILVFSKNYASSTWCLKELTKILDCKRDQGQIVIPVFYNVDPSDVRKQTGDYKRAFAEHEHKTNNEVKKWKAALTEASNLSGWDTRVIRDESELIRSIVNDVLEKLHDRYPTPKKKFVGIGESIEFIESLLEKAPMVGIWGMGGIGKTTIAMALFDKISSQYESCCFLENVREESERHGLRYLRDKLLSELLQENNPSRVQESTFVLTRLSKKKVLVVLDDVSNFKQLDDLVEMCNGLRPDNRIIVTTRYRKVFNNRVREHELYEVKELDFQSSLMLFSLNAFNKSHPDIEYEELSRRVVEYAKGIPLALKVLGGCLAFESKEIWESMLGELKKQSHADIQSVLRLSYDRLNDMHKEIFLDIACFFKEQYKEHVIHILKACGFSGTYGLKALEDHALISISGHTCIQMHDLIQVMGWNIAHEESKHLGRRSRLFNAEDIYDVLKYNKGTDAIKGICLDISSLNKDLYLRPDVFNEMINLRYLKIYSSWGMRNCNLHFLSGLESISDKLGYLEWHGCSLKSLPSTFSADKLCELHMQGSHVEKLWNGVQDLVNLKKIDLSFSKNLIELPDFSKASNLEFVYLFSCTELKSVRQFSVTSIGLSKLHTLSLSNCLKLTSVPELPPSVRKIVADNCISLKTVFPLKGYKEMMAFENCWKLKQDSLDCNITLKPVKKLEVYYPGSKVPEWFNRYCNRTKPASDLVGFIFCVVCCFCNFTWEVSFPNYNTEAACECYLDDDKTVVRKHFICFLNGKHSDCVCIWYDPYFCKSILAEVERRRARNQCATYNPKLSFEFVQEHPKVSINEWAMCPIYESDSDVEIMLRMGTKRRQDINELEMDPTQIGIGVASSDDQQSLPPCKKLKLSIVPPVPQGLELMLGSQTKKSGDDIDELEALCMRMKIS